MRQSAPRSSSWWRPCRCGAHGVARADERRCELDPDSGLLECVLVAQPRRRRASACPWSCRSSGSGSHSTSRRSSHGDTAALAASPDVTEIGAGYVVTLINTATLEQLYLDYVCTWPGETPPEPPPPPPTPGRVRRGQHAGAAVHAGGEPAELDRRADRSRLVVLVQRSRAGRDRRDARGWTAPARSRSSSSAGRSTGRLASATRARRVAPRRHRRCRGRPRRRASTRCAHSGVGGHVGPDVERHPDGLVPARPDQPHRAGAAVSRRRVPRGADRMTAPSSSSPRAPSCVAARLPRRIAFVVAVAVIAPAPLVALAIVWAA